MYRRKLILRGLVHFWRMNLAIVAGMAVGTAVIAGALIVGDSVRGSLRQMTLDRLGEVDYALLSNRFFRAELAADLNADEAFQESYDRAVPIIFMPSSLEHAESAQFSRGVNLYAVDERFWELDSTESPAAAIKDALALTGRKIALNELLASNIGAAVGDSVLIRLEKPDPIPSEAVHGRRTGKTVTLRLEVTAILPNSGFGRFGLQPSQQLPLNAYVPLDMLRARLDLGGDVNMLLVAAKKGGDADASQRGLGDLQKLLQSNVELRDLDLKLRVDPGEKYLGLESVRMVLRESDAAAARQLAADLGIEAEPTLTYLANAIEVGDLEIPYSTVTALDASAPPPLGPLYLKDGTAASALTTSEIYLNEWAAEHLRASVGDVVRLRFNLTGPEGQFDQSGEAEFVLAGVVAMKGLGLDSHLTPDYPGISDALSIRDWDPPFELDLDKITDRDEAYWKTYRGLPKAFISLDRATELWTSRFGRYTSLRIAPPKGKTIKEAARIVTDGLAKRIPATSAGLVFRAVKADGLQASSGATDFGGLFIGFSFFIIVSAMLLVRLLFSLGVELRAREAGILLTTGYTPADVRNLFLGEGAVLAVAGGVAGLGLGVGFAAVMLYGLRTWWVGSVGTSFLALHLTPFSLALGFAIGVSAGVLSVYMAVRSLASAEPLTLLTGSYIESASSLTVDKALRRRSQEMRASAICFALALACTVLSNFASASAQAGLFYAGGALLLVAGMVFLSAQMRNSAREGAQAGSFAPLLRLGARNSSRRHARSLLTVGLVASASFIIVAVAALRHGEGGGEVERDSGNGGYALLAESDSPIVQDLNSAAGRDELGFSEQSASTVGRSQFYPLRFSPGDDASCLNLYRPGRPRLLGASRSFTERGGFAFRNSIGESEGEKKNPWSLLEKETADGTIPAIGDYNTVMWILHSGLGKTIDFEDDQGRTHRLKIVALLSRSALQSELVISEKNFISIFPERSGYQYFFIETPEDAPPAEVQQALEAKLRPYGFDAIRTQQRIDGYHAVENTYLSTFQALGGLGLLLGTMGLAIVMLRNVIERRGELALLTAVGYRPGALATLVLSENGFLLVMGLVVGTASALLSVAPNVFQNDAGIQWGSLALTLLIVLGVGMLSGLIAVVSALRTSIIDSLRNQ